MLRHVWNEQYAALYDRTYRVLYDAGINEKLANDIGTRLFVKEPFYEQSLHRHSETHE